VIVYQADKAEFLKATFSQDIERVIEQAYTSRTGHKVAPSELKSWASSLLAMAKALNHPSVPDDCGVAVEYGIPQTSKRVDVLVSGADSARREQMLIVELKQWTIAQKTPMDGIVRTRFAGGMASTSHPSYQAWSYAELLRNFNQAVDEQVIPLHPCAYLHNCEDAGELLDPFYDRYTAAAPVFLAGEGGREALRHFLCGRLAVGDGGELIRRVEAGKVRPSKQLVDAVLGMLKGVPEYVLIDEQKVAFEAILAAAAEATAGKKRVLIVEGGPGTGKSVVAVNLLARLLEQGRLAKYVSKNRAPRQVIQASLSGSQTRTRIDSLFGGSGEFHDSVPDRFDTLLVDEAHRLNAKSGMFSHLGENQIGEIIRSAKCSVFFLDEQQTVTWKDIGSAAEVRHWAAKHGVKDVEVLSLPSQFRCAGSDGYLAWLDDALQIRATANRTLEPGLFDFLVVDDPNELRRLIEERNKAANKARLVAGYCWDWKSQKDPTAMDVVIPSHGFAMQWNLASDQGLWIRAPESVKQVGCIHTCQGLEVDYIGVIIGPDLIVREGKVQVQPKARSRNDTAIKGYQKMLKEDPEAARRKAEAVIKNTYRTLMTRGMRGCYVYCTDPETNAYLKARASQGPEPLLLAKVAEDPAPYSPTPEGE
jgi:uncharacterized protein